MNALTPFPSPSGRGENELPKGTSASSETNVQSVAEGLVRAIEPSRTAVIVVDIQNDFVHSDGKAAKMGSDMTEAQAAVTPINRLIECGRAVGAQIIYARIEHAPDTDRPNYRARYERRGFDPQDLLCATGSWGADFYDPLLQPQGHEAVVTKYSYDAFQDTNLNAILQSRGIDNLIVTGVVTNLCVQTTAEHGFGLGYTVVIPRDATAGDDEAAHEAALRNLGAYFGDVVNTDEIIEAWAKPSP